MYVYKYFEKHRHPAMIWKNEGKSWRLESMKKMHLWSIILHDPYLLFQHPSTEKRLYHQELRLVGFLTFCQTRHSSAHKSGQRRTRKRILKPCSNLPNPKKKLLRKTGSCIFLYRCMRQATHRLGGEMPTSPRMLVLHPNIQHHWWCSGWCRTPCWRYLDI